MSPVWRVRLFGALTLQNRAGEAVRLPGRKPGALLACLAYFAPEAVARERLMEMLWPDADLDSQRNRLSLALSALRKLLDSEGEPVLASDRTSVRLDAALVSTDTAEFDRLLLGAGQTNTADVRLGLLEDAVALYRGPLLADLDIEWLSAERTRRAEQFAQASRELAALLAESGKQERAIAVLRRTLDEESLREEAHRELLALLIATGRSAEAVRHFRELERTLDAELGVAPDAATRAVMEGGAGVGASGPASAPAPSAPAPSAPAPSAPAAPAPAAPAPAAPAPAPPAPAPPAPAPPAPVPAPAPLSAGRWRPALAIGISIAAAVLTLAVVVRFSARRPAVRPVGTALGVARYAPVSDEKDSEPTSVATDPEGNIYVTGFVQTAGSDVDFLTLKYAPDCQLAWRRRLNGSGNDCDRAYAMEVDRTGNVYVVGESYNGERDKGGTEWDMTLVKYDREGRELWRGAYNGPPADDDRAIKVCLDRAGDVYVGGWSRNRAGIYRFLLMKYTPEGERLWARPFDPPAAPGSPTDAQPFDMAVDPLGNVYLAGEARIAGVPGEPTRLAFLTLRYDRRGNLIWSRIYGGDALSEARARKVALSAEGGIYVGGFGVNARDARLRAVQNFVVVRYNAQGDEQSLVGRVDDGGRRPDRASDFSGGLAVGPEGRIAVTGHKPDDTYMVAQFAPDGRLAWEFRFGNPVSPFSHYSRDLAVDRLGYVCCTSLGGALPKGSTHIVTLKRGPDGASQWCRYYQAPVPGNSQGIALTLDRADNVIVAGRSFGGRTNDIVVLKYSP